MAGLRSSLSTLLLCTKNTKLPSMCFLCSHTLWTWYRYGYAILLQASAPIV